jgi:hypothetical protein
MLLAAVVGSGIMGERLAGGNVAVALLANTIATGAALVALIVAAAHVIFEVPLFFASRHVRSGMAQAFSEFVATFGLLAVIWGCARLRSATVRFAVAAYIEPPRHCCSVGCYRRSKTSHLPFLYRTRSVSNTRIETDRLKLELFQLTRAG